MNLSEEGKDRLIKREGLRLNAYTDSAGIWTIGVGHTPSYQGQKITKLEAMELFDSDIEWTVTAVNQEVKQQINQDQFDSLISFCFNVGRTAFEGSTLLKMLNRGKFHLAANQFHRWNKITVAGRKEISGGLVYRRASEIAQWYSILNTKERVCNHRPIEPDGRSVVELAKNSKTAQGGAAVAGLGLVQAEEVTNQISNLSATWAEITPMIVPYISYIVIGIGIFIFVRRWYDSKTGKNY